MFSTLIDLGIVWIVLIRLSLCENLEPDQKPVPKYNVKYYHANIPRGFASAFVELNDKIADRGSFEILGMEGGLDFNKYLCFVPSVDTVANMSIPDDAGTNPNGRLNRAKSETEMIQRGMEVIEKSFTRDDCVYVYGLNGGYWTLGFCYGDKVVQFHENIQHFLSSGQHKPEYPDYIYVLGRFEGASNQPIELVNQSPWKSNALNISQFSIHESSIISDASTKNEKSRFLQQTLYNGEICDLTKSPRSIDIIYKCDPNHRGIVEILDLQEIKTCLYQMIISVPQLCSLEEFRPNKVEDQIVNIDCKLIDEKNPAVSSNINYQDFFYYTEDIPNDNSIFPISNNFKVSLSNYHLSPCGHGFYLGQSKIPIKTSNPYFNFRHILVFNGHYDSSYDLLDKLGKMLQACIGSKILSPHMENNRQSLLSWNDSFIVWFELYDFYGSFVSLVKISRDGYREGKELKLRLIDPESMLDQDGDLVKVPKFDAPNNAWNFEKFSKGNPLEFEDSHVDKNVITEIEEEYESTSTDIITVTVTESQDVEVNESTQATVDESAILKKLVEKLGLTDINELQQAIDQLEIELELQHDEL